MTPVFAALWERRFASFRQWQACTAREVYRENWIDCDELEQARPGEAFQFFGIRATTSHPHRPDSRRVSSTGTVAAHPLTPA